MATYTYKIKEGCDLRHSTLASEKEYGVQCVILRNVQEHSSPIVKALCDNRVKDVAFLHVAIPGKTFDVFEHEKYKLALTPKAYIKLLEFFVSDYELVLKRMESDYHAIKTKKAWMTLKTDVSIRDPVEIVFTLPLDVTNAFALELKITKRIDVNKTNILLAYTDEEMGFIHLPPQPMMLLAESYNYLSSLYNYKEPVAPKRSRQS
jgi:hypothetical protein